MEISYAKQTIDAPNPFRRFAHRNRVSRSIRLTLKRAKPGLCVLDFGCGSGLIVQELLKRNVSAIGYEPYMKERTSTSLPIFSQFDDVQATGPYGLVALFETIEHLSAEELDTFLALSQKVLTQDGGILISGPIEMGPAVILKEISRYFAGGHHRAGLRNFRSGHSPLEMLKAAFLGIAPKRAENFKCSHKGFDFRSSIRHITDQGWRVEILSYGPLPLGTWYGNSQVFLWVDRPAVGQTAYSHRHQPLRERAGTR